MSNSLLDQLKKSGLVNDKKARQVKQEQYQNQKQQKGKKAPPTVDEAKQLAQQALTEKLERDRLLNQQRKEESERKAIAAQIRQLIETNRITNRDGEIAYNFTDGSAIKRIHVNASVHQELSSGQLAIVKLDGRYELVPNAAAEKVRERDASYIITHASYIITHASVAEATAPEDDPYAVYKVPDDLMW
jgi:hypothetical protein